VLPFPIARCSISGGARSKVLTPEDLREIDGVFFAIEVHSGQMNDEGGGPSKMTGHLENGGRVADERIIADSLSDRRSR